MTIGIRISGYNSRRGTLITYQFHITPPPVLVYNETSQFEFGREQARAIILGLQALAPLDTFEVRVIDCDSPGGGTQIDGKDLSLVGLEMQEAIEIERKVASRRDR